MRGRFIRNLRRSGRGAATTLAVAGLACCQSYALLPLPARAPLAASLASLDLEGVDPAVPLGVAEVSLLAVANSPDLAATRSQRGVSRAQVLQAGVLANPSVTGSISPLLAGPAANAPDGSATPAYGLSLSYDIRSLITRPSRRREAAAASRAVDATLLWQEWQTIAQARLLVVDIVYGDRLLAVLRRAQALLEGRAKASRAALASNDVTLATAAPDFAALQLARGASLDQERVQLGRRHQLDALLGLRPDVVLVLAGRVALPPIDEAAIRASLATLASRRPDLAALRAGYDAQDARLRTALLSQFPNVSLGVTGGSDNSNVRNIGPQATLELPVFDHNQGQIAIEGATRAQLHAEYAGRLAGAEGQVGAMLSEIALIRRQLAELRGTLTPLTNDAAVARSARASGDLDERTALDLILAPVTKEQEIVTLEQTLNEQVVAIATLTGAGLPPLSVRDSSR